MKRSKVAPLLTALVEEFAKDAERDFASETWALARSELRALLAVARAVQREGRPFADDEGPACECGACRAYARLDRVSRG